VVYFPALSCLSPANTMPILIAHPTVFPDHFASSTA
jgi:hypothetical protein